MMGSGIKMIVCAKEERESPSTSYCSHANRLCHSDHGNPPFLSG